MNPPKFLQDILKRDGNNFDILRLLAALAVIVGHSYAIAPQPPLQDFVLRTLHFDYSGSLAVKFFFFLSGLLVTNSIISKPDAFLFLLKRALRIFPGLLVCLLISVVIVGPIFTQLPLSRYFTEHETWNYLFHNFFLSNMIWRLPGVFEKSQYGLNGSLWTLPYEVLCYIFIAIFYGLGLLKNKIAANIFFIAVLICSFVTPNYLPAFFSQNPEAHLLPGCFVLGALFANNKAVIPVSITKFVLIWLLVIVLQNQAIFQFLFYVAFFYSAIFFSSLEFVKKKLKLSFDASYGVYVYGFMIQQVLHAVFPGMSVYGNQLSAAAIAVPLGIMSWFFVEKRFIALGNKIATDNYLLLIKQKGRSLWKNSLSSTNLTEKNIIVFVSLTFVAFLVHALVLKFIFPGYYSPLVPQHSDFYIPAAFAHSTDTFKSLLSWPRPVNMIFLKLVGYCGIHGSIACIIAIVCMNCALSGLLLKKILRVPFNWQLLLAFAVYCGLLFSQPYFYTFYAQDAGAQLAYFFLILGTYILYANINGAYIAGNLIFFCCCLLSFLSKETYGLTAFSFAFLWFLYTRKQSVIKALLPVVAIGIAFMIAFIVNVFIKSTFVNLNASSASAYHISLSPAIVAKEFFRYLREAVNISNLLLLLFVCYAVFKYNGTRRRDFLFIIAGCIVGTGLSILPNSLLPNHHYMGYSFNGAYLFYLPLLFLPLLYAERKITNAVIIIVAISCIASPFLNISKYKDNQWAIIQEDTQRNLLKALEPLISEISPSETPQKILVQGITFPFHPFAFPQSLRVFPNAKYAVFDVVNYNNPSFVNNQKNDLVRFISPVDTSIKSYDRKWNFDNDGKLVNSVSVAAERMHNTQLGKGEKIAINRDNFSQFITTGFYNPENGIRWTNGNAAITLSRMIENTDSIIVELNTYLPPICKDVIPKVSLADNHGIINAAKVATRKENLFSYLFVIDKKDTIQKVNIISQTIDASPDQRVLSFPFISIEIRR